MSVFPFTSEKPQTIPKQLSFTSNRSSYKRPPSCFRLPWLPMISQQARSPLFAFYTNRSQSQENRTATGNICRLTALRCNYTGDLKNLPKNCVTSVSFEIWGMLPSRFYPITCRNWALFVISPLGRFLSSKFISMRTGVLALL